MLSLSTNQSAVLVTIDQSQAIILTKSIDPTWLLNVDFILARTSLTSHGLKLNVECLRFAEVIWYKCLRLMFDHTQMSVQFLQIDHLKQMCSINGNKSNLQATLEQLRERQEVTKSQSVNLIPCFLILVLLFMLLLLDISSVMKTGIRELQCF